MHYFDGFLLEGIAIIWTINLQIKAWMWKNGEWNGNCNRWPYSSDQSKPIIESSTVTVIVISSRGTFSLNQIFQQLKLPTYTTVMSMLLFSNFQFIQTIFDPKLSESFHFKSNLNNCKFAFIVYRKQWIHFCFFATLNKFHCNFHEGPYTFA